MIEAWTFDAALFEPELPSLERVLSEDERERARRLRRSEARLSYVVGRGILRRLLARHVGCAPEKVVFCYTRFGKPELSRGPFFNVSNASGRIAIVLGGEAQVGIDLERVRSGTEWLELARRYFSPGEAGFVASLTGADRDAAFFRIWTRKEAYLKALGSGLSTALDSFCVPFGPLGEAAEPVDDGTQAWEVRSLACGSAFEGACVSPRAAPLVQHCAPPSVRPVAASPSVPGATPFVYQPFG